jgi:hypothetical protein
MTATASITIQGTIIGDPTGSATIGPFVLASAAANGQEQVLVLASGDNTITVPALPATSGCIIVLDPACTIVTKLKGVGADTGIAIGKTTKQVLNWDPTAAPASFVLNSASIQTGFNTYIKFF